MSKHEYEGMSAYEKGYRDGARAVAGPRYYQGYRDGYTEAMRRLQARLDGFASMARKDPDEKASRAGLAAAVVFMRMIRDTLKDLKRELVDNDQ